MKNLTSTAKFDPIYTSDIEIQLRNKIKQYGDFNFEDITWYCSNLHKDGRNKSVYTIFFNSVNLKYLNLLKYFSLILNASISDIQKKVYNISYFMDYLMRYHPNVGLSEVDRNVIIRYEEYLTNGDKSALAKKIAYSTLQQFFKVMNDFPDLPKEIPTKKINPFLKQAKIHKNKNRYIPDEVIKQFDQLMKDENNDIPLEFRTIYWLLRSVPNRISEILSMKQDCLKTLYSYYVLQIPTFKQNGGYLREEIKTYPLINVGHGAYLISLVKKLQEQTQNRLSNMPIKNKHYENCLFLSILPWSYSQGKDIYFSKRHNPRLNILDNTKINHELEYLAKAYNITDKSGKVYIPTTHQFRHNAITDRMYFGQYTFEQTSYLTKHKSNKMLTHYTHHLKEAHKQILTEQYRLNNPEESPVSYQAQIRNLDDKNIKAMIALKPDAYLTWETNGKKGVGICSSISSCNPKGTSVHFECYACDWFVPKAEYLEDYKKEWEYWMEIIKQNEDKPNRASHLENAIRNANLLERIINICEIGIEKYNKEIIEKLKKLS